MYKSFFAPALLSLSASLMSIPAFAAPFSLNTSDASVELPQPPQKIAVYDLSILDTLNALGVEAQIVPQATFAHQLSRYGQAQFVKAGTLFEPDMAKLQQLKPDLILVGSRSSKKAEALQAIAPTLDLTADTQHYMQDLNTRTLELARAFNRVPQAQQQLKKIEKLQQQLQHKTRNKTGLMLFAAGDHYMPHAANERFGFVYELSGLKPVLPAAELSGAPRPEAGSPEALALQKKNQERLQRAIQAQPDYIIVLDRGAVNTGKYATKTGIKTHPVLSTAQAVKHNRVIFVDADAWYLTGAGLANTEFMLKELAQGIR